MGLLTNAGPPPWHPATAPLRVGTTHWVSLQISSLKINFDFDLAGLVQDSRQALPGEGGGARQAQCLA